MIILYIFLIVDDFLIIGKLKKWIEIIVINKIMIVKIIIINHNIGIICGIKEYYFHNNFKLTI